MSWIGLLVSAVTNSSLVTCTTWRYTHRQCVTKTVLSLTRLICAWKQNILQLRDLRTGQLLKTYNLDVGTIREFSGKPDMSEFFFQFGSFLTPGVIYRCDIGESPEAEPTVFRQIVLDGFDPSQFETQQVFYPSKDGTRIPMFIVKKKAGFNLFFVFIVYACQLKKKKDCSLVIRISFLTVTTHACSTVMAGSTSTWSRLSVSFVSRLSSISTVSLPCLTCVVAGNGCILLTFRWVLNTKSVCFLCFQRVWQKMARWWPAFQQAKHFWWLPCCSRVPDR